MRTKLRVHIAGYRVASLIRKRPAPRTPGTGLHQGPGGGGGVLVGEVPLHEGILCENRFNLKTIFKAILATLERII